MTNARGNANNTDTLQQHSTKPAVIATPNPATASRLVYHEPEVINLRVQHQERWRWSEASRSRGAACLYEPLLEKEPSFISEDRAHTAPNIPQQKQHSTIHRQAASQQPTQLPGGKRPRDSSYPGALCGQRAGALTSFVARLLLLCRPEALIFRWHIFFCVVCARRRAWPELQCSVRPYYLSRECLKAYISRVENSTGLRASPAVLLH